MQLCLVLTCRDHVLRGPVVLGLYWEPLPPLLPIQVHYHVISRGGEKDSYQLNEFSCVNMVSNLDPKGSLLLTDCDAMAPLKDPKVCAI